MAKNIKDYLDEHPEIMEVLTSSEVAYFRDSNRVIEVLDRMEYFYKEGILTSLDADIISHLKECRKYAYEEAILQLKGLETLAHLRKDHKFGLSYGDSVFGPRKKVV